MKKIFTALFCIITCAVMAQNTTTMQQESTTGPVLLIKTTMGDIKIMLYDDTPMHRDNFLKLAKEGYYDGVLFHRVINDFMIQTGDPTSKYAKPGEMLGEGDPNYTIEAEILYPKHYHKRGAIAAARTGDEINPERRSSGSQFYIVTSGPFSEMQLDQMNHRLINSQYEDYFRKLVMQNMDKIKAMDAAGDQAGLEALQKQLVEQTEAECHPVGMTPEIKQIYMTEGGTPHLDGSYTVFGEVLEGMDVVDSIQKVQTDNNDRPVEDVRVLEVKVLVP